MQSNTARWLRLGGLATLAVYAFWFMEWLFNVTRPSFMDRLAFWNKAALLALPALITAAACLLGLVLLYAAGRLFRADNFFTLLASLIPAAFLAFTALMTLDNFTYTVFKLGVVSTHGFERGLYGLLFLALLAGAYVWVRRQLRAPAWRWSTLATAALLTVSVPLSVGLFLVSGSSVSATATNPAAANSVGAANLVGAAARPNILLIGSDGLDSSATSIYNTQPDNTPYLRAFAAQSLLAENNFPNANITAGSLTSIFTSKLPTQTRLMYPPDILTGANAVQHLPGILKDMGYYNAEISVDYYADPNVLNLQNSFVMINGRSATVGRLYTRARTILPEDAAYFIAATVKRLSDRLFHIFYLQTMSNPYATVNQKLNTMSDQDRMGGVISLFRDIHQPLFIHVHMMGTHTNDDAVYAQGVVDFDHNMRVLMDDLKQMGRLDNTLVVVYTDHGYGDVSNERIPLIFHFPGGAHAGTIATNAQNLDIAPTILDAIGVTPPAWMSGVSLLRGAPPAARPIFSAAPGFRVDQNDRLQLDLSKIKPPFYQFGSVGMVICQNWYALNTASLAWKQGSVRGYPNPCAAADLPNTAAAQQIMVKQLRSEGFDTTTLEAALAKK